MSELRKELGGNSDVELEHLLRHASPRQTPDVEAEAMARSAVHEEWRKVSGQHRRRQVTRWAVAASVLVAVFAVFSVLLPDGVNVVQVAEIQKSFGSVAIHGPQSMNSPTVSLATIHSGQTVVTGTDAGMAVAWKSGGSVRIDKNSEVEFLDGHSIYLHTGRVYFDSTPSQLVAANSLKVDEQFVVKTDHGVVSHVGTMFMTKIDGETLIVRVREGRVAIHGTYHDVAVELRQKVSISGRGRPSVSSDNGHGGEWAWIGNTSPSVDVDGVPIHQFLIWAGRELGLEVHYEPPELQEGAERELVFGPFSAEPYKALEMHMSTTKLKYQIDRGVIHVYGDH